ncbi:hypothetical protein L596_030223 [Steinernema carpocapsae]|uniref:Nuclear receptor domain-containing protein n=1 Tax=Steinernema carpocapsae TaxID=34508 RepID=A0A4U5LS31_STECR|nr:hypothetical protein L596_030223 [Steinernema carpocapsae]
MISLRLPACTLEVTRAMDFGAPTTCFICGNAANCLHYGVPSCSGCKSFFRRCVASGDIKKCPKIGKCVVKHGGSFCRRCRYEKCIRFGMKVQDVRWNKFKPKLVVPVSPGLPDLNELSVANIGSLLRVEDKFKSLLYSTFFPYSRTKSIPEFLAEPCHFNEADKYQIINTWEKCPSPFYAYSQDDVKRGRKMWGFVLCILTIDYFKTFDFFRSLDISDQIALLKGSVIPLVQFIKGYTSYLRGHKDTLRNLDETVPFNDPLFECEALRRHRHSNVLRACVDTKIAIDKIVLLKAIIALNSAAPNLSTNARNVISEERVKYVKALMKMVQLENDSKTWVAKFHDVYTFVELNLIDTRNMTELFFLRLLPLLSSGVLRERLWFDLYCHS